LLVLSIPQTLRESANLFHRNVIQKAIDTGIENRDAHTPLAVSIGAA